MERDYEHRYPTIHDKVRYTDLSSCESALHKLAEQVESVNEHNNNNNTKNSNL